MDELQKLYDVLVREGKYTKSFDEFKNKWSSDTDYQNKVFDVVSRDGLYTKDKQSFFQKYSGAEPVFQEQQAIAQPQVKKKEPTMVSKSGATSSESPKPISKYGQQFAEIPTAKPKQEAPLVLTEEERATYVPPKPKPFDIVSATETMKKAKELAKEEYKKDPTRVVIEEKEKAAARKEDELQNSYSTYFGNRLGIGGANLNEIIASAPESLYRLGAAPQNAIAALTGWDIEATPESFKKTFNVTNPVLDLVKNEKEALRKNAQKFERKNYETTSIYDNITKGNYSDAFELLGAGIGESAPVSIAMMLGGAALTPAELTSLSTVGFLNQNVEEYGSRNPNASEIEKTIKGLGLSASESVFEAVGTGTIGSVYKDIIKREGVEQGAKVFRDGLVQMYKSALKKYGAAAGAIGEGVEEVATQITQNMINGDQPFNGVPDAFLLGVGSGTVMASPISAANAVKSLDNKVNKYYASKEIGGIIKDTDKENLSEFFNVSVNDPITKEQISISKNKYSKDLLNDEVKSKLKNGTISEDDAKQIAYVFNKLNNISNAVQSLDVSDDAKLNIANLLNEKQNLELAIQGKDEAIVVKEKNRISEINKEITDAIQKQTTDEGLLRTEQPQVGLQELGEGDQVTEVITEEAKPKEEVVVALSDVKNTSEFIAANNLSSEIMDKSGEFFPANPEKKIEDILSERYHEVKLDGSNPDLVKAVEDAVGKTIQTQQKPTEEAKPKEEVVFSNDKKLNNFLNELSTNGKLETNPINQREFIYNDGTSLELNRFDKGDKNEIVLQDINVLDKSKGEGSKVMKDITNTADKLGYKITLEAKPFGRDPKALDIENLVKFYEKNGFQIDMSAYGGDFNSREEFIDYAKDNPSESIPMFREPSAVAEVITEEATPDFQYEEEVKKYKWYVVDTENKKAVTGFEFKEDAKDALSDYDGDPNFKLVSKTSLGKYGIEDPTQKFISAGKNIDEEVADLETLLRENRFSSGYNEKYKKNAAQIENHRRLADLARKALAKIAPNVKIILHETTDSYDSAVPKRSQGAFITKTNTIHINLQYADVETVPHEVFHAILFIKIKTDRRATKVTKEMFESVKKVLDKDSPVYKQIEEVASNYDETLQDEERLAELFGILSVNYEKLPVPAKNAIVRFIEKIAKLFGLDATKLIGRTDNSVINLLNTLSEKVAKGEEIQESEIAILGVGGDGKRATLFKQVNNINDIIKLARANGFSEEAISTVLNNRGFSEQEITDALSTELGAKATVEVTEELLPGNEELLNKVDALIERQQSKDIQKEKIAENVKKLMEKSDAYNNATDIQKEKLIRDANKKIGIN